MKIKFIGKIGRNYTAEITINGISYIARGNSLENAIENAVNMYLNQES